MAKKVADAGHEVASHSYSHDAADYLNATTPEKARAQVEKARNVIAQATGVEPRYVRPPGGNINEAAVSASADLTDGFIGWSVDTLDWTTPGSDVIVQTALEEMHPGAVVLMHDGGGDRSQTVEALDQLIPKLQAQGYQFVTVSELVEAILAEREGSQGQQADGTSADTQDSAAQDDSAQDDGSEGDESEDDEGQEDAEEDA
jgi:peptidoglycan/xylan/chitin deacetylase (PgdA/CDA1 family)